MSLSQARTARQPASETRRSRRKALPSPLVLDRYRLHRRLGTGAYGTVWMARDERLERDVAVKIMPRERIASGRFEREARAAARLAHPGIVTLYEAAVDDEGAYLVSELVRGPSLDHLLSAGQLSDHDIVSIGIALCDALEHAHAQGVVHRDVKPSNVLVPERPVTPTQIAKLTDFGVARLIGSSALTSTGDVIGTPAYMAPEQAEGLPSGADADLYSMALVLYEALTGVNPVGSGTAANRARRLGAHLPPLRRQRRDLPHELGRGIDFALRPRPRERGRISDLRGALVAGRELVADEPGVVSARWGRLTTRMRRRPEPGAVGERETHAPAGQGDTHAPAGQRETHAPAARSERHAPAERSETRVPADKLSRALAALGAAATAAWLSIHVLGDPSIPPARSIHVLSQAPIPPALAALAAAAMVLALPRLGWLALTTIVCGVALAQGHSGFALLTLIVLSLPVLVMVRTPLAWPLAAGAPALGLIGLAGAWPALAARAPTLWRRAAIAAVGWVWLLFAAPVAGRVLYLPLAPGTAAASAWAGSPSATWHQLVLPSLNSGALAPVAIWALGAALLPWLVRGRLPVLDFIRVVIWSAALASATAVAVSAAHGSDAVSAAPSAVLGAVAGVVIALAPSWLSHVRRVLRPARDPTGLGGQFP